MSFTETKRAEIKKYLFRKIDEDDEEMIGKVADAFCISATSVRRYIETEIEANNIIASKKTKCGYALKFTNKKMKYRMEDIAERDDRIIHDDIFPHLLVGNDAKRIWGYTLPEIFNNSIEHSGGNLITVTLDFCCLYTRITITDNGIGIFQNIMNYMKNNGAGNIIPEDAVIELYKGKFTSKPENHSGEGIFFSMKLLDRIAIISDGVLVRSGYTEAASILKSRLLAYAAKLTDKGTVVMMQLDNETKRKSEEIFNAYADVEEGFFKTKIPVFEACLDHEPISRSQARRILARLESFKEVELDFEKVEYMAQGFADEVFRVFANNHPETKLIPVNMNSEVQKMYLYTIHNKVVAPKFSES